MYGVEQHLPSLVPFLFDSLKHEKVRLANDQWRTVVNADRTLLATRPRNSMLDTGQILRLVYTACRQSARTQDPFLRAYDTRLTGHNV